MWACHCFTHADEDFSVKEKKVRIPKQKRSIEKKKRIMDAAIRLFSKKGIHKTNSKEIAALAEVSIGSFYSYFTDKKSLFSQVLESYLDRHFEAIWQNESDPDIQGFSKDLIRFYLKNLLKAYSVSPEFHSQTHVLRYSDPDVKHLYDLELDKELIQLTSLLEIFGEELAITDYHSAAVLIQCTAESFAHRIMFLGHGIDKEGLLDEFAEMLYRYLKGTS